MWRSVAVMTHTCTLSRTEKVNKKKMIVFSNSTSNTCKCSFSFSHIAETSKLCSLKDKLVCASRVAGECTILLFHKSDTFSYGRTIFVFLGTHQKCFQILTFPLVESDQHCNCSVPCTRVYYKPSLSYAQQSSKNIERLIGSDRRGVLIVGALFFLNCFFLN